MFSGPDIPIGENNIDAAKPESEGGPGAGEEGALSNPGYSFFQQWVTGHGSSGDEDDSGVTGNGPSSNPEQDSPGDEDDERPNLPSGDYCALDVSHTMCKFEVADKVTTITEVLRPLMCSFKINFHPKLYGIAGSLPFLCKQDKVNRNDSGCEGCCSRQAQRSAEKVSSNKTELKLTFALLAGWPRGRRLTSLGRAT